MNQGKKLAESGVLLAIFALMLLMLLYIPLASIVIFFFMPAPFALISSKYDLKWSSLFLVASMLIAFIISGVGALPAPVMAGLIGITIGYYIRTNKSKLEMFIVSTLLFIACLLVFSVATMALMNINIVDEFTKMFDQSFEQARTMMSAMGQEDQLKQFTEQMAQFTSLFQTLLPSFVVIVSIIMTALMVLASKSVMNRTRFARLEIGRLRDLSLPRSLLWYYLLSMLLILFIQPEQGEFLYTALMNIQFILEFFIMLQGISLLFFYSHSKGWSKGIPIFVVILTAIIPIASSFVRILGVMDLGFRLRESIQNK
ncbi:YybS family protein [Bacillus testis]|uniref:YybS family protein n=1 Tax=Bacillus testis TaxID=1622072 RepID=UPI00067EE696|nr:YybS family protein [Bacillus testis]